MRTDSPAIPPAIQALLARSGVRYLLAGGGLFLLDTCVFLALHVVLGVGLRWSQLCSRTVGASAGFVVHRRWTFNASGDETRSAAEQGAAYTAVMLFNIAVSPFVVDLMSHLIPSLVAAKVLSEVILVTETYILFRWVFRAPDEAAA